MSVSTIASKPAVVAKAAVPLKRFVATIEVDGRDLQTVTEWWAAKPAGVSAQDPNTGQWLTSRIYDPNSRESYPAV